LPLEEAEEANAGIEQRKSEKRTIITVDGRGER